MFGFTHHINKAADSSSGRNEGRENCIGVIFAKGVLANRRIFGEIP
jgi:hypothetical protein